MIHIVDLNFREQEKSIASFILETAEGPIVIETGPYSTISKIQDALSSMGYRMSDVKHVFLTHIHLDHAGAAWAFAKEGATVYVHPLGYKHLADPSKLMGSAKRIYGDLLDILWGRMEAIDESLLVAVNHEEIFNVGGVELKAWHTPGHAVHHIAWQLDDKIFAGDVAGVKIDDGSIIPPCPPPDINIEDWIHSLNILRNLSPNELYLAHFGRHTNVEEHFNVLEKRLLDWAAWMKPYFDQGEAITAIIPAFEAYVSQTLLNEGAQGEVLKSYEKANPAGMSVAGLLRYWRKKMEKANQ